jgi:hypothetical protein
VPTDENAVIAARSGDFLPIPLGMLGGLAAGASIVVWMVS